MHEDETEENTQPQIEEKDLDYFLEDWTRKKWTVFSGDVYHAAAQARNKVRGSIGNVDLSYFGIEAPKEMQQDSENQETGLTVLGGGNAKENALTKWQDLKSFQQNITVIQCFVDYEIDLVVRNTKNKVQALRDQMTMMLVPINRMIRRLTMLIKQLEVYLGLNNGMKQLLDGKVADPSEPVHIFQLPFYMDEEVGDPTDYGINFTKIEHFDKWLVQQHQYFKCANHMISLPYQRCIALFQVRRKGKNYNQKNRPPWIAEMMKQADEETYVLIKNGNNIWRIWTAEGVNWSFGKKLFPDQNEIAALKEKVVEELKEKMRKMAEHENQNLKEDDIWEYEPTDFQLEAWTSEEHNELKENYERVELRYKLNLLLIQGLLDRQEIYPALHGRIDLFSSDILKNPYVKWLFGNAYDRLIDNGEIKFDKWLKKKSKGVGKGSRIYWLRDNWYNHKHSKAFRLSISDDRRFMDFDRDFEKERHYRYKRTPDEGVYIVEMQTKCSIQEIRQGIIVGRCYKRVGKSITGSIALPATLPKNK